MNASAIMSRPYNRWEIGVDTAVHAVAIVAGLVGGAALFWLAITRGEGADIAVLTLYSASVIAMFCCSAAYNLGRTSRHRNWLRNLDQAAIFLMIAGNYTPFTVLYLQGAWSLVLTALVWSIAFGGILIRLSRDGLFDRVSLALYLGLGWIGLVALFPLTSVVGVATLTLLVTGGLFYTAGVAFHLWERLPFQNAIWHGFVLTAAALHYAAVASSFVKLSAPA